MAKTTSIAPIASMSGRINKREKRGAVMRQQHYRDDTGRVVAVDINKTYTVCRPRIYARLHTFVQSTILRSLR